MKGIPLASLLLFCCLASPVRAGLSLDVCKVYRGTEKHIPGNVRQLLAAEPGGAVRVCSATGYPRAYYLASRVEKTGLGVCRYTERDAFTADNGRRQSLTLTPPPGRDDLGNTATLMFAGSGTCPIQGDPRYVAVEDASDEIFLKFVHFWNEAISSKAKFEAAFGNAPLRTKEPKAYGKFEGASRPENGLRSALKLQSFLPSRVGTKDDVKRYVAILGGRDSSWGIIVDLMDGELSVWNIAPVIE